MLKCYLYWQVYSEQYMHQMGVIGYFPATMVKETQTFTEDEVKIPTTVSMISEVNTLIFWKKISLMLKDFVLLFFQNMDFYCE